MADMVRFPVAQQPLAPPAPVENGPTCWEYLEAILPAFILDWIETILGGLAWLWKQIFLSGPQLLEQTPIEKEALAFAEVELAKVGPNAQLLVGFDAIRGDDPLHRKIRQLLTLYQKAKWGFESSLGDRSITDEQVKQKAQKAIYLAYAIGYLMLQELPGFIQWDYELSRDGPFPMNEPRTPTKMIVHPCAYQHYGVLLVAQMYHRMKGNLVFVDRSCTFQYGLEVPQEYTDRFTQEGTLENSWRLLHNAFCKQVWQFLSLEGLNGLHMYEHFVSALQEDLPEKPLVLCPKALSPEYDRFAMTANGIVGAAFAAALLNPLLEPQGIQISSPIYDVLKEKE